MPLAVVGDPVDQLVTEAAELAGVHPALPLLAVNGAVAQALARAIVLKMRRRRSCRGAWFAPPVRASAPPRTRRHPRGSGE